MGLASFSVLHAFFELIESCVKQCTKWSQFEKLVFLIRLKWNFPVQDLAYSFSVSNSSVGRIFDKWLHSVFWCLKSQIRWPSRREIQKTMPQAFFIFFGSGVAVIIGYFELRIISWGKEWNMVQQQGPQYLQVPHLNLPTRSHILYSRRLGQQDRW